MSLEITPLSTTTSSVGTTSSTTINFPSETLFPSDIAASSTVPQQAHPAAAPTPVRTSVTSSSVPAQPAQSTAPPTTLSSTQAPLTATSSSSISSIAATPPLPGPSTPGTPNTTAAPVPQTAATDGVGLNPYATLVLYAIFVIAILSAVMYEVSREAGL